MKPRALGEPNPKWDLSGLQVAASLCDNQLVRIAMESSSAPTPKPLPLWREAVEFYAEHAAAVTQTLLPPTLLAYVIAIFLQDEIRNLYRHLVTENPTTFMQRSGVLAFQRLMIPVQLLTALKQWWLWACYCFALVGICALIENLSEEGGANGSAFASIREHPGRFLKCVSLSFGMLMIAYGAMLVIIIGIYDIQSRFAHTFPRWEDALVALIGVGSVSAVLVRWIFAVPLATLHGFSFGRAIALSDRMTDTRALALWALILESEVAGYFALQAPSWALFYLKIPPTTLIYYASYAASLLLSAMTQAPLMIAVGLVLANWKPRLEAVRDSGVSLRRHAGTAADINC